MELGVAAWPASDPNYTSQSQSGTGYPLNIDAALKAGKRLATWFAPHEQDQGSPAPDLTLRVDAGWIDFGMTTLEVAAQTVSGFTIPSAGQHRIDRVVIDRVTGVASRVAGTAVTGSPSAVAPAIPAGKMPCCQVLLTSGDTAVVNTLISDERMFAAPGSGWAKVVDWTAAGAAATQAIDFSAFTAAKKIRVEIVNGDVSVDNSILSARTSTDDGATFDSGAGNYKYAGDGEASSGVAMAPVSNAATLIQLTSGSGSGYNLGDASTEGFSAAITIVNPSNTAQFTAVKWEIDYIGNDANQYAVHIDGVGYRLAAADVDGLQIFPDSGNVSFSYAVYAEF